MQRPLSQVNSSSEHSSFGLKVDNFQFSLMCHFLVLKYSYMQPS